MSFAASAFLAILLFGLGKACLELAGAGTSPRLVTSFLAGLVVFHLVLTGLQAFGVPWTRGSLALSLTALTLLTLFGARRLRSPTLPAASARFRFGAGDAVAASTVVAFALASVTLRSVNPDFVYHWGLKAKKMVLAGGVDFTYLAHPWNHYTHPDYPTLLPELYAATTLLAGRFSEPALLLWSTPFLAGLLWSARGWWSERVPSHGIRQAGIATLGLGVAAFSIGYLQPGGADLMIALALVAGAAALGRDDADSRADLELGTAAAFAAASKIEGVVLAGFLVGLGLLRAGVRRELSVPRFLRQVAPPLLVVVPWIVLNQQHGLFQGTNVGAFDPDRWGPIVEALVQSLDRPAWHGLSYSVFLLPLLAGFRPTRWLAAVALLQLAFYLFVYATTPVDPVFYIRSSFPRLLLHVVPAALLGAVVVLGKFWPRPTAP